MTTLSTKLGRASTLALFVFLIISSTSAESSAQDSFMLDLENIPEIIGNGPSSFTSQSCGVLSDIDIEYSGTSGIGGRNYLLGGFWTDAWTDEYIAEGHETTPEFFIPRVYTEVMNGGTTTVTFTFNNPSMDFEFLIYDIDTGDQVDLSASDELGNDITDCSDWTLNGSGDVTVFTREGVPAPAPDWLAASCEANSSDPINYNRSYISLTPNEPVSTITATLSSGAINGQHVYYAFYCLDSNLPVELTAFDVEAAGDVAMLNWSTSSESQNAGFEIEVADKYGDFLLVGFIESSLENTNGGDYDFAFPINKSGLYKFRLKQLDFDGNHSYSPVVEKYIEGPLTDFSIETYPNPSTGDFKVAIRSAEVQKIRASMFGLDGRKVADLFEGALERFGNATFDVASLNLPSGLYLLRIEGSTHSSNQMVTLY